MFNEQFKLYRDCIHQLFIECVFCAAALLDAVEDSWDVNGGVQDLCKGHPQSKLKQKEFQARARSLVSHYFSIKAQRSASSYTVASWFVSSWDARLKDFQGFWSRGEGQEKEPILIQRVVLREWGHVWKAESWVKLDNTPSPPKSGYARMGTGMRTGRKMRWKWMGPCRRR